MTWKYLKSISGDFGGIEPVKSDLHEDVEAAGPWSFDFAGIRINGDEVAICFSDTLPGGEQTTLSTVVINYVYVTPVMEPLDNLTAITDPGVGDDSTLGYCVGSHWLNQAGNKQFLCDDVSVGAAKWTPMNIRYQKAVVDSNGGGDYTKIAAAFAAGAISVFVRNGVYVEFSNIVIPDGGQLIGETMGSVIVVLVAGNSIQADATGGTIENIGTIAISHMTTTITGTGTTFTNLSPGDYIMIHENYLKIASIESNTSLTLADTYQGNDLTVSPYRAHSIYLGVRLNNLIVANSAGKGIFLRGLRNSTVYGVACKGNTPNFHIQHCGNVGIINGASENSNGDGICIDESVSVLVDTMAISNCTSCGIGVINEASGVIIDGSSCNSNRTHGVFMTSGSSFVNINDSVMRNNRDKGVFSDSSTESVVVVNCDSCDNGGDGIDTLGDNSSIGHCLVISNGDQGINVGNLSVISNNHIKGNTSDGLNLVASDNCTVIGNIIDGNGGDGVDISGGSNICNSNRIQYNGGWGIKIITGSTNNTVAFNYACTSNTLGNTLDAGVMTRFASALTKHSIDPTVNDDISSKVVVGDCWLNLVNGQHWMCTDSSEGAAVWVGGIAAPITAVSGISTNTSGVLTTHSASDHTHELDLSTGKSGGSTLAGGSLTAETLTLRGNAVNLTTGRVHVATTVDSTSVTTGAFTCSGGLAINKQLHVGGSFHSHETMFDHTSEISAALTAAATLTSAQVVNDRIITINAGGAPFNVTLPTAAVLVSQVGDGASIGDSWTINCTHKTSSMYEVTLVAGTGVTTVGTMVIDSAGCAAATFRLRLDNVTSGQEAASIYRVA